MAALHPPASSALPGSDQTRALARDRAEDGGLVVDAASDAARVVAGHYRVLDTYRFFAAIGVVLYHCEGFLGGLRGVTDALVRFQQLVDFFFVLSGFVVMHVYGRRMHGVGDYGAFLWKRFARLYPLHLATLAVCFVLALGVATTGFRPHDPSLVEMRALPVHLLMLQGWGVTDHTALDSVSWSISAEVFAYLAFPVLLFGLRRSSIAIAFLLAALFMATVSYLRAQHAMLPGSEATYDFGNLRALPSFFAGMAVCALVERIAPRRIGWWLPHGLTLLIVALMLGKAPAPVLLALFPLLVGLLAMAERGGAPTRLAGPACVLLGNASYAIYLLHPFVLIAVSTAARAGHVTGWGGLLAIGAVTLAAVVALGVASFLFLETPARLWLTRHAPFAHRRAG